MDDPGLDQGAVVKASDIHAAHRLLSELAHLQTVGLNICRQAGTSAVVTIRGGLGQSVEIPTGEPPDLIAARVNRRIRHLTETLVEMGVEVDR